MICLYIYIIIFVCCGPNEGTESSYWKGEEEEDKRGSRGGESITEEVFEPGQDEQQRNERMGGGVLGSIGETIVETIVEIAETTKEYVVGKNNHDLGERGGVDYEHSENKW